MIIYNKYTGEIYSMVSDDQDPKILYKDFPDNFKNSIAMLNINLDERNLQNYKIMNKQIVKRDEIDIQELRHYGKVLTEEERLNILLAPSRDEIQKAENTIEILTLIQEVL